MAVKNPVKSASRCQIAKDVAITLLRTFFLLLTFAICAVDAAPLLALPAGKHFDEAKPFFLVAEAVALQSLKLMLREVDFLRFVPIAVIF
jgi:hypothetical protein